MDKHESTSWGWRRRNRYETDSRDEELRGSAADDSDFSRAGIFGHSAGFAAGRAQSNADDRQRFANGWAYQIAIIT